MAKIKEIMGWLPTTVWSLKKSLRLMDLCDDDSCELRKVSEGGKRDNRLVFGKPIPFSTFNPTVVHNIIKIWSEPGQMVLDPFGGRGSTGFLSRENGRNAISYEIAKPYFDWASARNIKIRNDSKWNTQTDYKIYNGDSRKMKYTKDGTVDLIVTSPPFYKIEEFHSCEGQLADAQTYPEFLVMLRDVIKSCFRVAALGCYSVWECNYFYENGKMIRFMDDVVDLHEKEGWIPHCEIIQVLYSYTVKGVGRYIKKGHLPKTHSYLMVFYKPPLRNIKNFETDTVQIETNKLF